MAKKQQEPKQQGTTDTGGIDGARLNQLMERLTALDEERRNAAADMTEVCAEAKDEGFDPRFLRKLLKEQRADKDALAAEEAVLDVYRRALGWLSDTPLGTAALKKATTKAEGKTKPGRKPKKPTEEEAPEERPFGSPLQ
jgi:uncharacterized protein (UPF0335 family)